jgi:hypothetical protein
LHLSSLELIDYLWLRVELHASASTCLINQVDCLVRKESLGNVASSELSGHNEGRVCDTDTMMGLISLLETSKDGDGVLNRGLADHDLLEAALKSRVLLDVLAVLVKGGSTDASQLSAGKHGLQKVGGVHGTVGTASTDDHVNLVEEKNDGVALLSGLLDFLQNSLEAFFEFTSVLGTSDEGTHVERDNA